MSILENVRKTTLKKESSYSKIFIGELDDSSRVVVKLLKNANVNVYRTLAAANSHYFPEIYEICEEDDDEEFGLTVIEEFIRGRTVSELVKEKSFTQEEIFRLMEQLCEAVSFLHRMEPPLIHRDLKPQNLILTEVGALKIIDFNAARFYRPDADSDTVHLGTVEYAPPEQFGFSQTDVRSDIYCIGVILYEISRGKEFHQKTDRSSLASDGLDAVIGRCTMYDPAQRYQSVEELSAALSKCRRTSRRVQYRPLWIGGGAVAAVVVILALSFPLKNMISAPVNQPGAHPSDAIATETSRPYDTTDGDYSRPYSGETGTEGAMAAASGRLTVAADIASDAIAITFPAEEDSRIYTFRLYDGDGEPVSVLELRYNHTIPRLLKDRVLLRYEKRTFNASQSAFTLDKNEDYPEEAVLTLSAQELFGASAAVMADFTWDMSSEQLPKLSAPTDFHWNSECPGTVMWTSPYPCVILHYKDDHLKGMNSSYNTPDSPHFIRSLLGPIQIDGSGNYTVQVFALGDWTHGDSDPVMTEPFSYRMADQRMAAVTEAWFRGDTVNWQGVDGATEYQVMLYGLNADTNEWKYMGYSRSTAGVSLNISDWMKLMKEKNEKLGVTIVTLSPDLSDYAASEESKLFMYE